MQCVAEKGTQCHFYRGYERVISSPYREELGGCRESVLGEELLGESDGGGGTEVQLRCAVEVKVGRETLTSRLSHSLTVELSAHEGDAAIPSETVFLSGFFLYLLWPTVGLSAVILLLAVILPCIMCRGCKQEKESIPQQGEDGDEMAAYSTVGQHIQSTAMVEDPLLTYNNTSQTEVSQPMQEEDTVCYATVMIKSKKKTPQETAGPNAVYATINAPARR
ncbi:hypothetical protein MATL_G00082110 [Megalops atlanticus]|uniref:Uncharacterized protein n=1 Tax=Megalops atlanticus TaxID=7932 RepID=A0A9D3Q221_MEGAT|nr:hypothetical protein MATL_G00082110 [Megalops atlanticus]